MKNLDIKKLLFYIITTILIGTIPSIFVFKSMNIYNSLNPKKIGVQSAFVTSCI